MSVDVYSQFLRFHVVESAAATFTEGDPILTGASVNRVAGQNIAIEIRQIGVQVDFPQDSPSTGASEYVGVCLSTRSGLTAMPNMDEEHVIYRNQRRLRAGVATYLPLVYDPDEYMPQFITFDPPLLVSHSKIYPYVQSSNSSSTANIYGYIIFTYVLLDQDLAIEALEAFR